jgi:class 3 adenylate cyclase
MRLIAVLGGMLLAMGAIPETLYARDGDRYLAYQVVGDHGPALMFVPPTNFPIDLLWDEPTVAGHMRRLSSFSRLIPTDLLGAGSSDRIGIENLPAIQAWRDGLLAVLDATETESASIFTIVGAALPALLLAASHPDRVRSLILWSPYARFMRAPDHPCGLPERLHAEYMNNFATAIRTGTVIDAWAPSWADDPARRRWWNRGERIGGGPGFFQAMFGLWIRTDVRPVLGSVQAPTLVLGRRGDQDVIHGHARDVAERIPNAKYVEFDGIDSAWFAGDTDSVADEIESFLTGARSAKPSSRVLSTVLLTDIVGSTERAAALGDDAWTKALAAHDHLIEQHVTSWRGEVVKFTGDGALATFDGPARAIECARALSVAVEELGLKIRVGLHTGEVEKGDGDVHGIAVHVAARIMALAGPSEVFVSGVIPPLVLGSRLAFTDRGEHELKGVPGSWRVLAVDL